MKKLSDMAKQILSEAAIKISIASFSGKVSSAAIMPVDVNGRRIGDWEDEYDGDIPNWLPGGGDYFSPDIQLKTGQILNWKRPSKAAIKRLFPKIPGNHEYIYVTAKTSDMCAFQLISDTGEVVGEHDGYVPDWMPGEHYGDYMELHIELSTGKIVDWKPPTMAELKKSLKEV